MTVRVERDLCIGSGYCLRYASGVFELDGEEIAIVVDADAGTPEELDRAARSCPAGAIFVEPADVA
jgi:ferredoxin